ncbi:c-type cytochrome [Parvularcula dongshanensis]|uniref:Cytochrome c n=1 Tax=Parvularcula dongshanensis TaxID=1173995 RepID=A0A840HZV2_9PROT|nr:cytochrome c family protein [Parvularcula dongshanensis]MBB4657947.1 cytochrome c [Parvularcula dongshanensis]
MRDPLFGNKVAAAILVVLLLAVGLPVIVTTFAELAAHLGTHHDEEAPYPGGVVYFPGTLEVSAETEAEPVVDLGTLMASADAERGARGAAICSSCHSFDKGGPNGTGPHLWDVVGREVASVPGFSYSSAMSGLGGDWTYEKLDALLENSQGYIPGTQMAQKIRKADKRADILAYLGSLSDDPVPFPEPAPVEPPAGEEVVPEEDTAESEAAESAADTVESRPALPGEAVLPEDQRNDPGDEGYPGDESHAQSDYRSSDPDGEDTSGTAEDGGEGLPNAEAAQTAEEQAGNPGGQQ